MTDKIPEETLDDYLCRRGIAHFTARELCTMRRAGVIVPEPPRDLWPNMIPTALAAEAIRARMGCPLLVGNGYRPEPYNSQVGGARRSQHLYFRALDLDLPASHSGRAEQEALYRITCELWLDEEWAGAKLGIGLYRPWRGTRVHIDTGYRRRYWSKQFVKPILEGMR